MSVAITYRQWDSAISRIANANLKTYGRSLSAGSMRAGNLLFEVQDDRQVMIMRDDWRDQLKRRYLLIASTLVANDIDYDWRADTNVYPRDTVVMQTPETLVYYILGNIRCYAILED